MNNNYQSYYEIFTDHNKIDQELKEEIWKTLVEIYEKIYFNYALRMDTEELSRDEIIEGLNDAREAAKRYAKLTLDNWEKMFKENPDEKVFNARPPERETNNIEWVVQLRLENFTEDLNIDNKKEE